MDDTGTTSLMADTPTGNAPVAGAPAAPVATAAEGAAPAAEANHAEGAAPAEPAAAEAKPDEAKADDKPAPKAPEAYTFAAPDGFEINEALAAEFTPVLKDLDLSQEQADKLMAFAPKLLEPAVDSAVSKTLDSLGYTGCKDWAVAATTDQEFGGDKFAENLAVVKAARDQFASPELRKMLETTVLGNNPEMLRLFYRIGKQITPDGYVPGGTTKSQTNAAQRVYDASKMNP